MSMDPHTRVRRLPEKAVADLATLHAVLDAAMVAHVGIVDAGQPYVLPMACARDGERLLLHGSTGSRLMRLLAEGSPCCATITLLDGLVFARSAFESSMHYRSAMVFGTATELEGEAAIAGLRLLTEHLLPGRWETLRAPTRKELAATAVLQLPLQQWSLKVSAGPPEDDPADLEAQVWAGVLPLHLSPGVPVDAPGLRRGLSPDETVAPAVRALAASSVRRPDWAGD